MTAPAHDLFGDLLAGGAARGRGATPRIERVVRSEQPNPAGRYELTYRYRPLQRHAAPVRDHDGTTLKPAHAVACNLAWLLFRAVGGFRLADDELVRTIADLLVSRAGGVEPLYTAVDLRRAIEAKAASLRADDADAAREKRVFVPKPENFFTERSLDYWIEQHPETRRQRERAAAAQRRQSEAARLDAVVARRAAAPAADPGPPAAAAGARRPDPAAEAFDAAVARRRSERRNQLAYTFTVGPAECALELHRRNVLFWETLDRRQRSAVLHRYDQERDTFKEMYAKYCDDDAQSRKALRDWLRARIALEIYPHLQPQYADLGTEAAPCPSP